MGQNAKVISLEFNELCPNLMRKFIDEGHLPHFKQFENESLVFETDAEESGELLNPWVQWVTVHTGLPASEHQVTTMSEGHKVKVPAVWDVISATGKKVWVCGSMNTRYDRPINGFLLADPWSTGLGSYPPGEFDGYLNYVRSAVQEHTSSGGQGGMKQFLKFMLSHGLTFNSMMTAAKQLISEKMSNTKWKRARVLDLFQRDLFFHYYNKSNPDFATFFLNSTAHFQHCYWRNMEPEKFVNKPSGEEQRDYANAIRFGYQCMDSLVGEFMRKSAPNTTLIFATALSQQPYLDREATGGRRYYHLNSKELLVSALGLNANFIYEPVMAEQFYLKFPSEVDASRAEQRLISFHVKHPGVFPDDRTRLFGYTRKENALLVQCRCTTSVPPEANISSTDDTAFSVPFYKVFYRMSAIKSGKHHPAGMLWIRQPDKRHILHPEKVSIRSVAPTILKLFEIASPTHMIALPLL